MTALRLFWLTCLIAVVAAPAAAHDELTLDPHNATPGVRLEVVEVPGTPASPVEYRVRATGFPRGIPLSVWTQNFGQPFRQVASGLQVDDSGDVVSSKLRGEGGSQRTPVTLRPGAHPPGAAWRVALVSPDRALRAFAGAIPHPLTAHDGSCIVTLELISHRGDHFVASGVGFAPGDEVVTELRYSGRTTQKRQQISPAGLLPHDVISHEGAPADRRARYLVKGRSCQVAVEYKWGDAALQRR